MFGEQLEPLPIYWLGIYLSRHSHALPNLSWCCHSVTISLQIWSTPLLAPRLFWDGSRPIARKTLLNALLLTALSSTAVPALSATSVAALSWPSSQAKAALTILDTDAATQLLALWDLSPDSPNLNTRTSAFVMQHVSKVTGNPELWQNRAELHKLAHAINGNRIEQYLNAMTAPNPVADGLKTAQIRYMDIESTGGWPRISEGPSLQEGIIDSRVTTLRQRLAATGDLPLDALTHESFDTELSKAVQNFQRRHNLPTDGIVGRRTLQELNIPVHKRLAAIRLSRSRAEELPAGSRADYVWVNIAGASTHLVRQQQTIWSGRSVVGKRKTQTPEMHSKIETLVLNPFWMVPDSIAKRSLLPRAARDPGFLARMKYRAFDSTSGQPISLAASDWPAIAAGKGPKVRLMQSPGPRNALGKVKFLFPNEHSVYLHDTPSKKGFQRTTRTLSNGCVRVEGALSLAAMILEPQGWNRTRIEQTLAKGKPVKLTLDRPLPVHTLYLTAIPGQNGEVTFYNDSYGRDTSSALAQLN